MDYSTIDILSALFCQSVVNDQRNT